MKVIKISFILLLSFGLKASASFQKEYALNQLENVKQIQQDAEGQVYLISDYKACAFDAAGLEVSCRSFDKKIKELLVIDQHRVALAVDDRLLLYENKKLQSEIRLSETINSLAFANHKVFIGTSGEGLFSYDLLEQKTDSFPELNEQFINALLVMDSTLWVALDHGITLFSVDAVTSFKTIDLPDKLLNRLLVKDSKELYAFGEFGDLYRFQSDGSLISQSKVAASVLDASSAKESTYLLTKSGCYELQSDLSLDLISKGNYTALCALNNQLLLAAGNAIISIDVTQQKMLHDDISYSLYAENDSDLWVGGTGKIYHFFGRELKKTIELPATTSNRSTMSALYVSDEHIYAGTMGEGLFIFSKDGELLKQLLNGEDNNQKNIIQMHAVEEHLWVAYLNGIVTLDFENLKIEKNHSQFIGNNYLYSILAKGDQEFFAGTSVNGLMHYKEGKVSNYLKGNSIFAMSRMGNDLIVSTENNGLHSVNPERQPESIKLLDLNKVFSIASLGDQLLLAGENEILVYNPQTNNRFLLPDVGLNKMQFNSISSSDSYLFVGFENGVLRLDKEKLKGLGYLKTFLDDPKLFDQSISLDRSEFAYSENTFTFSFRAYNYYKKENTLYKYRLLGIDSSWQTTTQQFVNFYNLPHGDYVFEVAAATSEGFRPLNPSRYAFSIAKPFWQQPVFIVGGLLFIALLIYLWMKRREKQIIAKGKLEQEHLRFEFDQLKNQVDPHFLFNSLNSLIGMIEEDPKTAVNAVSKLSNLYRSILEYAKVDTVDLKTEIKLAEQYFEIHKLRYRHLIQLNIQKVEGHMPYRLVPLSCQFLIENAIKHNQISKAKQLQINIYLEDAYLVVENNLNPKLKPVDSTAVGLTNLKRRYAQLSKKSVEIVDDGERFKVKLPLIYG